MAFPVNGIIDSFTRANADPISGSWSKATYGTFDNLKIVSNAVTTSTSNANDCVFYYTGNTSIGADCEVYVTSASASGDVYIIIGLRYTSGGNGYKADWDDGTSRMRIFRDDSGTRTQLGSNITQNMNAGDSFGLEAIGSSIKAYYKASGGSWTQVGSTQTDATYSSAGRLQLGMWLFSSGETVDDFGGGTITSATNKTRRTLSEVGTRMGSRQLRS